MTVIPSLSYVKIIHTLERVGFVSVRQTGSHIQMLKITTDGERISITIPAYKPVPSYLLAKIMKKARLSLEEFQHYL